MNVATGFLLAVAMAAASPAGKDDAVYGTYLIRGRADVQVSPFPRSEQPGDMTVTLARSRTPGRVSVGIEARGFTCALEAIRSSAGVLDLVTPATCAIDLREPDARGHVDARLRSGRGIVREGRLSLDLRFDVDGRVSTRIARTRFNLFDTEFTVPEGWTPSVPLRGTVTSKGSGPVGRPGPAQPRAR
jgi:hypothetical protein